VGGFYWLSTTFHKYFIDWQHQKQFWQLQSSLKIHIDLRSSLSDFLATHKGKKIYIFANTSTESLYIKFWKLWVHTIITQILHIQSIVLYEILGIGRLVYFYFCIKPEFLGEGCTFQFNTDPNDPFWLYICISHIQ
jgi:hypothetical protein